MIMGRTCKLTPELTEKICKIIKDGNYSKVAAAACGICEKTFYNWLKKGGEAKSGKYFQFLQSITHARAEFETTAVKEIGFKNKEWLLERRHPKRWGRKDHITQDIKVTNTDIVKKWLKDEPEPETDNNNAETV